MPVNEDGYQPRDSDDIYDDSTSKLASVVDDPPTDNADIANAMLRAQSEVLATYQEQDLQKLYDATFIQTSSGAELTRNCAEIGVVRRDATPATGVVTFQRDSQASVDYTIPTGTAVETLGDDPIRFETIETVTLASGTSSVDATVRATEGGEQTNVAANTLTVLPNAVSGVDTVTNQNPTGNTSYTDTNGDPLVRGTPREDDEALRQRALTNPSSFGGSVTLSAIGTRLRNIDAVTSVQLAVDQANDTIEPIVRGADDMTVAEAIEKVTAPSEKTVGGNNGTAVSVDVPNEFLLGGSRTINFSRPTAYTTEVTIDLVYTDTYVGDDEIIETVVDVVGGTDADGVTVVGEYGVGKDVYITELERAIEARDGVKGTTSITFDTNGDGTNDVTTDGNGLEILAVPDEQYAATDASAGDVTINSTQAS